MAKRKTSEEYCLGVGRLAERGVQCVCLYSGNDKIRVTNERTVFFVFSLRYGSWIRPYAVPLSSSSGSHREASFLLAISSTSSRPALLIRFLSTRRGAYLINCLIYPLIILWKKTAARKEKTKNAQIAPSVHRFFSLFGLVGEKSHSSVVKHEFSVP